MEDMPSTTNDFHHDRSRSTTSTTTTNRVPSNFQDLGFDAPSRPKNGLVVQPKKLSVVLMTMARLEFVNIVHWVKYSLALGFEKIIIYDNNDVPRYQEILTKAGIDPRFLMVIHFPGSNFTRGVQYYIFRDFLARAKRSRWRDKNYRENLQLKEITHFAAFDTDEYLVIKRRGNNENKQPTIQDLVRDYIKGPCAGLTINWDYFGSGGLLRGNLMPYPVRFVHRGTVKKHLVHYEHYVKSIVDIRYVEHFDRVHVPNFYFPDVLHSCDTNHSIQDNPFSKHKFLNVAKLNHYRSRTEEEFLVLDRRPDVQFHVVHPIEHSKERFRAFDTNELGVELDAFNFWMDNVQDRDFSRYPLPPLS